MTRILWMCGIASRCVSINFRRNCVSQPITQKSEKCSLPCQSQSYTRDWAGHQRHFLKCSCAMKAWTRIHTCPHSIMKCDKPKAETAGDSVCLEISPRQCYKQVIYLRVGEKSTLCVSVSVFFCFFSPFFFGFCVPVRGQWGGLSIFLIT